MGEKLRLDIPALLPGVPDARDSCLTRLRELIEAKEGIDAAHIVEAQEGRPEQICIHFAPDQLSLGAVRDLAHRAGAELDARFGHLLLPITPMHARKARSLSERLARKSGIVEAAASPDGVLRIEFDRQATDEPAIRRRLGELNIPIEERAAPPPRAEAIARPAEGEEPTRREEEHKHAGILGANAELIFSLICGGLLLAGWLLSVLTAVSPWVSWSFYVGAYVFGGFFTAREALEKITTGRFEIDFLMMVAAIGAAALGEWAEGALLLFLFSLGHSLEHYAMGRARRAIEALAELAPRTALVRRDGQIEQVPVDALQRDDIVIVKPNERIPADGFVVKGESSINEAPITGESVPVDKQAVDDPRRAAESPDRLSTMHRVFAGSINQSGALEIQVTKLASESTLARVVQMVREAETQKSPTQRFTDKFERYFVPAVLALVVVLLFAFLVIDEPFARSFYRAMAVLVAASPCALAIATPSAVLSGVARAARGGVLVKGGRPLEHLGRLGAIAFDKTGTLTEGKPRLTDVVPHDGVAEQDLLRIAIAVERLSDHPLAEAMVRDGQNRLATDSVPEARGLQSITGRGVKASIDGEPVYIGKDDLFDEIEGPRLPDALRERIDSLEAGGRTTMIVRKGQQYLGILGLMDTPREAAQETVRRLRQLGVSRMIMISGDNQQVADAVANAVGIDEAWGDLMPDDKVESIKKLRRAQDVAMVGDGVNDAPAMANATVGIAMGAAGSDVALETADVALMADDLSHLPFAVGLSRRTRRVIQQNLWLSLGMVAVLIPATIFGLNIGLAVVFHEGSTLIVVFNALRLLAYQGATADGNSTPRDVWDGENK